MVVLPEVEYEQLSQCKVDRDGLTWPSDTSLEREQKLYELSLRKHRYANMQGDRPTYSNTTVSKEDPAAPFETEISHFPNTNRSRAQRLLDALKRSQPEIGWTSNGEVILGQHGSPFVGSNIVDLIYHATAVKRRKLEPVGWSNFLEKLIELNIPTSLYSEETLREIRNRSGLMAVTTPRRKMLRKRITSKPLGVRDWISVK